MPDLDQPQPTPETAIAVIEDSPLSLSLATDLLTREGYRVRGYENGTRGIEGIRREPPDLILLDIGLPDVSGFEVCEALKADPATREIPVVFISAHQEPADKLGAFEVGGVDFITKPFQAEEVMARIRTHLDLHQLRRDLEERVAERTAELAALNAAYERFFPHELLDLLEKERITDVGLGDQIHRNMAVMFTDIRDFTSHSETMTPHDNFGFINAYLKRVSPVIRRHGGVIDKYIGDSIMSLFAAEVAAHAVDAAIDIRRELAAYNEHRMETGRRPLNIGTGIHIGGVMLGIIGEEKRLQGTVISDGVNLASRLESLTKHFGVSIIISKQMLSLLPEEKGYHTRFLGLVQVKGKREPVLIYELFDGDPDRIFELKLATRPDFERALHHYHREEFKDACTYFKKVSQVNIQDHAAWLLLNHATRYRKQGIPTDWVNLDGCKEPLPHPN